MANIDDSDELKEQSGRIVTAGEPDSDTWRITAPLSSCPCLLLHFCGW